MWEFGEEFVKMRISRLAHNYWPAKQAMWEAPVGIWRVFDRLDFASHSLLRPSHKSLAKLSAWLFFSVSFLISLQTLYKPSLPTKCKKNKEYSQETFERKNPSQTLESYRLFTHNPLHYFSRVSIYSYLSIYTFWVLREVLVPMGSIRRNHWVADAIGQYYRI